MAVAQSRILGGRVIERRMACTEKPQILNVTFLAQRGMRAFWEKYSYGAEVFKMPTEVLNSGVPRLRRSPVSSIVSSTRVNLIAVDQIANPD